MLTRKLPPVPLGYSINASVKRDSQKAGVAEPDLTGASSSCPTPASYKLIRGGDFDPEKTSAHILVAKTLPG